MHIIHGGRQTGRTTRLLYLADASHKMGRRSIIVCHSNSYAEIIKQRIIEQGLQIDDVVTYHDAHTGRLKGFNPNTDVFVDNVEMWLQSFFTPYAVAAITILKENETSG